ncbi:hypothetical protein CEXT_447981, partial [Caerostris extrusa]
ESTHRRRRKLPLVFFESFSLQGEDLFDSDLDHQKWLTLNLKIPWMFGTGTTSKRKNWTESCTSGRTIPYRWRRKE